MAPTASTEAERAARRQADRERLEQAARALLASEGWQRWVRVRATNGLARYSLGNQLLIALQKPEATFVAGFRAFLKLNRCVRKGEKAIRILAPMTVRQRDRDETDDEQKRTVFRSVAVFDTLSRVRGRSCLDFAVRRSLPAGGGVELGRAVVRVRSRVAATIPCRGARGLAGGPLVADGQVVGVLGSPSWAAWSSGAWWTSAAARKR